MTFPAYASYRYTDIELIDTIPSSWTLKRLKRVAMLNPSKSEVGHLDDGAEISFLPMEAIGETGEVNTSRTRPVGEVRSGYSYFADGDVVFAKVTPCFENGKGALLGGLVGGCGFGTTELTVLRPRDPADAPFLRWLIFSDLFRGPGAGEMLGAGGLKRVPDDFVASFPVPWPSAPERQRIAAFLDRETAKIDALVEEQRRLIELLKEKRQAVISHVVTKGLDRTVPMKDSGVEWLGEVPAHWAVKPLKHLAAFRSGGTPNKDNRDFWDGEVPWASAKDLKRDVLMDTVDHLTRTAIEQGAATLVPVGSVLVLVRGMMLARTFPVCEAGVPMTINQDLKALLPASGVNGSYLAWLLRGTATETLNRLDEAGHGTKALRMEAWVSMQLPMPAEDEQSVIVAHLERAVGTIDALCDQATAATSLLQERRAAIISAAVTGKIDVRNVGLARAVAA